MSKISYICIFIYTHAILYKKLKTSRLFKTLALAALTISGYAAMGQADHTQIFTTFKLEARADADYMRVDNSETDSVDNIYGFNGRYFNLLMGGNLGEKFSYFFRQRIVAQDGSVKFFDNTDFLYLNYNPTANWTIRLGKDALAVGGFEYDAPPIDVLYSTHYWDNFYCFQLGLSGIYRTNDGKNTVIAQVSNSPFLHYGAQVGRGKGSEWMSGLMAYSVYWSGSYGHFKALYSANLFESRRGRYMGYIALGHKLAYNRWSVYLDLIHHSVSLNDWGRNFGVVGRADFFITPGLNLFIKGSYEQNKSEADIVKFQESGEALDCLVEAGHTYSMYGLGFEWRPSFYRDVRLHGFVACKQSSMTEEVSGLGRRVAENTINANLGITWNIDVKRIFTEKILKKNGEN